MKGVVNWIPLRIRVRSKNTQPHLNIDDHILYPSLERTLAPPPPTSLSILLRTPTHHAIDTHVVRLSLLRARDALILDFGTHIRPRALLPLLSRSLVVSFSLSFSFARSRSPSLPLSLVLSLDLSLVPSLVLSLVFPFVLSRASYHRVREAN